MEIGNGRITESSEVRKNVRFALNDSEIGNIFKIDTNAVSSAVNLRDEAQRHGKIFPEQYAVRTGSSQDFTPRRPAQGNGCRSGFTQAARARSEFREAAE